jgi:RNA polymerase sigma-70 factor, ECF subfamily
LGTVESSEDDEELLRRIGRGDAEALRQIYRRHGSRVYSLAYHIVRDSSLAEEVTQDVFLRIWEKSTTFVASKAKPLTWLLRITRNRSIDWLRRQKPRQELPEDLESPDAGPEDTFFKTSSIAGVRTALAALPVAQRKALSMAYYQGFTHREISQELGEPLGTVKSRIREAFLRLRKRMES